MNFTGKNRRIGLNIALIVGYFANISANIINADDAELKFWAVILSSVITILVIANNNLFRE